MLSLLRLQISDDICISRDTMQSALQLTSLNGPGRSVTDFCSNRHPSDCVRQALSYILKKLPTIYHQDFPMRIIRAEAKTGDKNLIKIDLHLQKRGSTVNYLHIGSLSYDSTPLHEKATWEPNSELPWAIQDKVDALDLPWMKDPSYLVQFGKNLFNADVRKVVDGLLISDLTRLWPATWLMLKPEQGERAHGIQNILAEALKSSQGTAKLSMIPLADSPENRETIGAELSDSYRDRALDMQETILTMVEAMKWDGKAKDGVVNDYSAFLAESTQVQEHLKVSFQDDFFEAVAAVDSLLESLSVRTEVAV